MPDMSGFDAYTQTTDATPAVIPLERHLLSALITTPSLFEHLPESFHPDQFLGPDHQSIFDAAKDAGEIPGANVILPLIENALPDCAAYVRRLVREVAGVSPADIQQYAERITEAAERRRLQELAAQLAQDARHGGSLPVQTVLARTTAELDQIGAGLRVKHPGSSLDDAVSRAIEAGKLAYERGGIIGLNACFDPVNRRWGGYEPGCLYLEAARPGMGKTSFALQSGLRIAQRRREGAAEDDPEPRNRVQFISLEMLAEQLGQRALSLGSRIPFQDIRSGSFVADTDAANRVERTRRALQGIPIRIEDESSLSVAAIRLRVKSFVRRMGGIELLIVDHLGYIGKDGPTFKIGGDVAALSAITKGLKAIAKEFRVPVLLLAQLSRGVEARDDKRPVMSDLRGSGTIEEDADGVLFLYREAYYHREPKRGIAGYEAKYEEWQAQHALIRNTAEFIFAKCRSGEPGIDEMQFNPELLRFSHPGDAM